MYKVQEHIEMSPFGDNVKKVEKVFNSYNQAVSYIKKRMKEIIRQDTLKFLGSKVTTDKLHKLCDESFKEWLEESTENNFVYVASYIRWSCFWFIKSE